MGDLAAALSPTYPTRHADRSNLPGTVTAVVQWTGTEWEDGATCSPWPSTYTARVVVVAAMSGEQAVLDLYTHHDAVKLLIETAGWSVTDADADAVDDMPALVFTATRPGLTQ